MNFGFDNTGSTSSISVTSTSGVVYLTQANVASNAEVTLEKKIVKGEISVSLYFSFVKHKFSRMQEKEIMHRIKKLYKLVEDSKSIGQDGLMEEMARMLAITIRQQQAYACGIQHLIHKDVIDKFIYRVKGRVVKLATLEEFPRVIPEDIQKKIVAVKKRNLFDEYFILYTDYTGEVAKTTEKKIIEKDPIIFGKYAYDKNIYYPIASWVDEYCDLDIKSFVEQVGVINTSKIPDITDDYFQEILEMAHDNHNGLKNATSKNYKELAKESKEKRKSFKDRFNSIFKKGIL